MAVRSFLSNFKPVVTKIWIFSEGIELLTDLKKLTCTLAVAFHRTMLGFIHHVTAIVKFMWLKRMNENDSLRNDVSTWNEKKLSFPIFQMLLFDENFHFREQNRQTKYRITIEIQNPNMNNTFSEGCEKLALSNSCLIAITLESRFVKFVGKKVKSLLGYGFRNQSLE